ncbi:hypothetical protein CANCADRAFT_132900 [Tortispora caseinolytica NRRL Y-17796]|uniref:Uncharacterized protein n=1 Tax=Tortispora caseinolytica NRRL Y-17796 TaxID=767744 RepID=A0A1E4TBA1_9ASCO|nr:hypothetical protein CANCADRAFT_132900 [Tortispora caseinolytica NRRL Y-17796]
MCLSSDYISVAQAPATSTFQHNQRPTWSGIQHVQPDTSSNDVVMPEAVESKKRGQIDYNDTVDPWKGPRSIKKTKLRWAS